jgi:hypothetical protein
LYALIALSGAELNKIVGVQAAVAVMVLADTQLPVASISAPLVGATVAALVAVNALASDNVGVPNGMATLLAIASGKAGNSGSGSMLVKK